jgi:NAD-dependent dihydropyrimidine dehydrogenase PreA subunit
MREDKWFGIPRKEITWHPTIDYSKCTACMACVTKCKNGVYSEEDGKPKVAEPYNCVVGCTGCQKVCPTGAISHPPKDYLTKLANRDDFEFGCSCGSEEKKGCC